MADLVLVYVEWKDHHMDGNWVDDVSEFHGPALVRTIGWIMKEDDEGITIAQSTNTGEDVDLTDRPGNLVYLLKSCIIKRVKIAEIK